MQLPEALAKLVDIAPDRVVVYFSWLLQFVQEMKRRKKRQKWVFVLVPVIFVFLYLW